MLCPTYSPCLTCIPKSLEMPGNLAKWAFRDVVPLASVRVVNSSEFVGERPMGTTVRVEVPLCVCGCLTRPEQARELLLAGADKISVNTAALDRPELVSELAGRFGTQCVVVAIDAARSNGSWKAYASAGHRPTGRDAASSQLVASPASSSG